MKNKRFVINLGLLVSWMILIFYMSNQPADISNKQSDLIIKLFYYIGIDLNSSLGEITSLLFAKQLILQNILYYIVLLLMF